MTAKRPNVVLILADDLGFSDLGCMGSEIRTPQIDAMAAGGALLTAMYNGARCCPTRAALLTGLTAHRAGIGHMGANLGTPAYQGYLRDDAATIAEVLRLAGYRTLMSGKWHVGGDWHALLADQWEPGVPGHPTPRQRGFDRFAGIIDGVSSFFSPHYLMRDDSRIEVPDDFYFTDWATDEAIAMVEGAVAEARPFFLYLGYTAPHWPLHAREEDIARYDGVYRRGWDAIRTARHEELIGRGRLERPWAISPRDPEAPAWSETRHQDWEADRMAVYAAMVDRMDQGIGRLRAALRRLGQAEDTLVLFLSDNGGCAEFMAEDGWAKWFPDHTHDGRKMTMGNRPGLRPGSALTYMSYDLPWANASNAPFRLFKHWVHEGGISTPLVVEWPGRIPGPLVAHQPAHIVDILPTILAATGAAHPGEPFQRLDGESFLPLLQGHGWQRQQPLYWEHEGNAAIRDGQWKLVRRFGQPWELYDMTEDRTELNDLAARNRPMAEKLARNYGAWAEAAGVRPWEELQPELMRLWQMQSVEDG